MGKNREKRRRKLYILGSKMVAIPFVSYYFHANSIASIAAGIFGALLTKFAYGDVSLQTVIFGVLYFSISIGIASLFLSIVIKTFLYFGGKTLMLFGTKDRIALSKFNEGFLSGIKLKNEEDESFTGNLRIIKLDGDSLINPLVMGVVINDEIYPYLEIPKGETIGVGIAVFDVEHNYAKIVDLHKQEKFLPDGSKIRTKLSGNLANGFEIIKENDWLISYKKSEDSQTIHLSSLVELSVSIGFGNIKIRARPSLSNSLKEKMKRWFRKLKQSQPSVQATWLVAHKISIWGI